MNEHNQWSSTFGFIMASAGAAVGLGNIWGFPYRLGQGGGLIYIAFYLIFAALIGYPLLLGEFSLGRLARTEPVAAGKKLGTPASVSGAAGILSCFIILAYYCFFGGMIINFLIGYVLHTSPNTAYFSLVSSFPVLSITGHILFALLILFVVQKGIQGGIERCSVVMMPLLLLMLAAMCVFTLTLPNSLDGIRFMLIPDMSKFNIHTIVSALTQVTFSLSIGQGIMVVYGSYLNRSENLERCALSVTVFDTLVALLAAILIIPASFSLGITPDSGPSLMFETLPLIFSKLPAGNILGFVFFLLLLFAAITSAVSMLETLAVSFSLQSKISKNHSACICSIAAAAAGIPVCLGIGGIWKDVRILGMDIFSFYEFISQTVLISVSLLCFCISAAKKNYVLCAEIELGSHFISKRFWKISICCITPLLIIAVFFLISRSGA